MKSILFAFLSFIFSVMLLFASDSPDYLWPVQDDRLEVTSVLCDKRSGHPHGGIDISHFGKVGVVPVVSVDDGVLMRIRDSRYGYGKALYILMADKKIAVYAHLARFSPKLQQVADSIRSGTGIAQLDYYYEPWEMTVPVKRGEVIGYGGKSGTSTAHLHFELRHDDRVNLNPLTNGFPIVDPIAPTILSVMVNPVDPQATVDGQSGPRLIKTPHLSQTLETPIHVSGRVGISIEVYDRHLTKGRAFSPYRITIMADQKPFFETRYESWGYIDQAIWQTQFDYDPTGKIRLYRAYNPYPVAIPFFSAPESGTLDQLGPGEHSISVTAQDAAGNSASVAFKVQVVQPGSPQKPPWPRGSGSQVLFNNQKASSQDGRFILEAGEFSFFEPIRIDIARADAPGFEGDCYSVLDPGVFIRQSFSVKTVLNETTDPMNAGLYRLDSGNAQWLGNTFDWSGRTLSAEVMQFGTFCLATDDTPPVIEEIVKPAKPGAPLTFQVRDDLSGMEKHFVLVILDGRLAITDYSPGTGKATVVVPRQQKTGARQALITAIDHAGNVAEEKVSF